MSDRTVTDNDDSSAPSIEADIVELPFGEDFPIGLLARDGDILTSNSREDGINITVGSKWGGHKIP